VRPYSLHDALVRAALIVNPFASRVTSDRIERVRHALPGSVDVQLTEARGHATELVRDAVAAGVDAVYVFSGDGGFNEALNGLDAKTPIGFLPGGGTSVLSRALGLPRDPVAAARRVARGETRRISLGRANGRRFGFNAGIGFDAEIVRRVDSLGRRTDGRRPGDVRFAWTLVQTVVERRARYDEVLELTGLGRAAFAFVANCDPYTYAGPVPLHVAPAARFELGLDVVLDEHFRMLEESFADAIGWSWPTLLGR
jgi:diacylglycerol kinase family enzyme